MAETAVSGLLREAVETLIDGIAGLTVFRNIDRDLDASEYPAAILWDGDDEEIELDTGADWFVAHMMITIDVAEDAKAARLSEVHRLKGLIRQALTLSALIGEAGDHVADLTWPAPEGMALAEGTRLSGDLLYLDVTYATAINDPFTAA